MAVAAILCLGLTFASGLYAAAEESPGGLVAGMVFTVLTVVFSIATILSLVLNVVVFAKA
jgi:hypothetical protein